MEEDFTPKLYTQFELSDIIVHPENVLGRGGCGVVYKGALDLRKDGQPQQWVAVKKFPNLLTAGSGSDEGLQAMMKEVKLAKAHPHVVEVLGYCKHPPAVVSEYMAGGDLQGALD